MLLPKFSLKKTMYFVIFISRAKCITDCRVNAKPTDAKVVEKEVKEANDEKH